MRVVIFHAVALVFFSGFAHSARAEISKQDIEFLVLKVTEVCAVPDKRGEIFDVTGTAGGKVGFKIFGLEGDFSIDKKTWDGLQQKFDTGSCVQTVLPILIENFRPKPTLPKFVIDCKFPVEVLNVQSGAGHKVDFICGPINKAKKYKVSFIGQVWGENVPAGADSWITVDMTANRSGQKKPNYNVIGKRGTSVTLNYQNYVADNISIVLQLDHCQHGGDYAGKNSWCSYSGEITASAAP